MGEMMDDDGQRLDAASGLVPLRSRRLHLRRPGRHLGLQAPQLLCMRHRMLLARPTAAMAHVRPARSAGRSTWPRRLHRVCNRESFIKLTLRQRENGVAIPQNTARLQPPLGHGGRDDARQAPGRQDRIESLRMEKATSKVILLMHAAIRPPR